MKSNSIPASYSNKIKDSQEKRELYKLLKSFPVNEDDNMIEYIKTKSHSIPLIVTRLNKIVKLRSQSYPSSPMDLDPDRLWLWYIWHGLSFSENLVSLWTYNIVVERWFYNIRVIECIDFHIFTWISLALPEHWFRCNQRWTHIKDCLNIILFLVYWWNQNIGEVGSRDASR